MDGPKHGRPEGHTDRRSAAGRVERRRPDLDRRDLDRRLGARADSSACGEGSWPRRRGQVVALVPDLRRAQRGPEGAGVEIPIRCVGVRFRMAAKPANRGPTPAPARAPAASSDPAGAAERRHPGHQTEHLWSRRGLGIG